MPYSVSYSKSDGVIHAVVSGEIRTCEELTEKALSIMGAAMRRNATRVVVDDRDVNMFVDAHDAHCLANAMDGDNLQVRGFRIACLYSPEYKDIYRIFETGHRNRSLNFRAFTDEKAALDWLVG